MVNLLKAIFHRPFTRLELEIESSSLLSMPPLPQDMLDAIVNLRGKNGLSLLEWWRQNYLASLKEISEAASWRTQRTVLIRAVLKSAEYITLYLSTKDAKNPSAWSHIVEGNDYFSKFPKDKWDNILFQLYITNLLSYSCLLAIGRKLYNIDAIKNLEIDYFQEFELSIRKLDVTLSDMMLECVKIFEDDDAFAIADLRDDVINPLIAEQFKVLNLMEEEIVNRSLSVQEIQARIDVLESQKTELAKAILAQAT